MKLQVGILTDISDWVKDNVTNHHGSKEVEIVCENDRIKVLQSCKVFTDKNDFVPTKKELKININV